MDMAARFISISIADFEKRFNVRDKRDRSRRAFELIRPNGEEAYYLCKLREAPIGTLSIKVLTTVRSGCSDARGCGEDAIRIFLLWTDSAGWTICLNKGKRINRSGGEKSTADDIIKRAIDRAREVASEQVSWCSRCSRPMVERESRYGKFLGCSSYKHTGCKG
jgi:hypothetical protein